MEEAGKVSMMLVDSGTFMEPISRAKGVPVDAIGFPTRVTNYLKKQEISCADEALVFVLSMPDNIPRIGLATIQKSKAHALMFIEKLETMTDIEIRLIATQRCSCFDFAGNDPIQAFPDLVSYAFNEQQCPLDHERKLNTLKLRFGIDNEKPCTLEEIGIVYDVSRERIRQIEKGAIRYLRSIITDRDNDSNWYLSDGLLESYELFAKALSSAGWLVATETVNACATELGFSKVHAPYLGLLMDTLGYKKAPRTHLGLRGELKDCWYHAEDERIKNLSSALHALNCIYSAAEPLRVFEVIVAVEEMTGLAFSSEDSIALLHTVADIEVDDDLVFASLGSLRSAADKAYRVLFLNKNPMHFSDIARTINQQQSDEVVQERNMTNQLVNDSRFVPIGRSGIWGLSSWEGFSTVNIVEAIESVLQSSGKPLELSVLIEKTSQIRPDASESSIRIYTNTDGRFYQTVDGIALSVWHLDPVEKRTLLRYPQADFDSMLLDEVAARPGMSLSELVTRMIAKTGLSESGIRQKINASQEHGVCELRGDMRKTVFALTDKIEDRKPTTKRGSIQAAILSILSEHSGEPMTKGELYEAVNNINPCARPTYYRYLDELTCVKCLKKDGKFFVVHATND